MKEEHGETKPAEEISKRLLNEDEDRTSIWRCPECGNSDAKSLWPVNGGYLYCGGCGAVIYIE